MSAFRKRWLETAEDVKEAEQVVSLLQHKVKKGIATPEELERYRTTVNDLVVYDWGTDSYQSHVPNMIAAAASRKQEAKRKRRSLIAPAPEKKLPKATARPDKPKVAAEEKVAKLPPLTRRPGKFAV